MGKPRILPQSTSVSMTKATQRGRLKWRSLVHHPSENRPKGRPLLRLRVGIYIHVIGFALSRCSLLSLATLVENSSQASLALAPPGADNLLLINDCGLEDGVAVCTGMISASGTQKTVFKRCNLGLSHSKTTMGVSNDHTTPRYIGHPCWSTPPDTC